MIAIGSDSEFQAAREFLRENYTEAMLAGDLGVPSVAEFLQREMGRPLRNTLARLFFGGVAISSTELDGAIPDTARRALQALGLLEQNAEGAFLCPVLLYPVYGLLLASDRMAALDGIRNPAAVPQDFVYLALTTPTKMFLRMLPETECDALLDVGAGSGIAALIASRYAKECWATDIAARSTLFAEFNARLNGVQNVRAVQGSLYDPVKGLTFDRIVCHPPYDPSLTTSWTFCDGGYDGEFVLRGVIEGLGDHLRPGGQFFSQARAGDRKGQPLEQRVREWLGEAHRNFDIALVVRETVHPQEFAIANVMTTSRRMEDYEEYLQRFREMGVEQLAYCNILIERKTDSSEPLTLRRDLGQQCTSAELNWLLSTQRTTAALNLQDRKPLMSTGFELVVRHACRDGELTPVSYVLDVSAPFREGVPCPPWIARLIAACDGTHTTERIYDHLRQDESMSFEQFESALKRLVTIGAIELR